MSTSDVVFNNVLLRIKDREHVDEVLELMRECTELVHQEPGFIRFEVYQSTADECLLFLMERWESQEALDRHREARAFKEIYVPRVLPLAEREPHISNLISE